MAKRVPSNNDNARRRVQQQPLHPYYDPVNNKYEVGIDEAGRGPMFGRVYVAGVILPHPDTPNNDFQYADMKDSKKFHSETKIRAVAEYIQTHALAWHVAFVEPDVIDQINIRQAVLRGMHECARECLKQLQQVPAINIWSDAFLLVDGNDFTPYTQFDAAADTIQCMRHETVEGGDNTYCSIAAASILAKVSRDDYVLELCEQHPELDTHYQLSKNKGYGTKAHLDGIRAHGITPWHRQSFGICRGL